MKKKVDHTKFKNNWFNKGASTVVVILWYFINVLFLINPINPSSGIKKFWLRLFGATIGNNVLIKPGVNVKYPWKLKIGDNSWIGERVWIDNLAEVTIGANVCVSQGAYLLTGNHDYKKESFDLMIGKITVEDGAWIGAKSVVCPGVTVGTHAVLSVNSVATKDLEAWKIYQGNPAIKVRERVIS